MGVLVAFFQYGMRFFRPIQDLSEKYNILQARDGGVRADLQAAGHEPAHVSPGGAQARPVARQPIEFDHVWFAYKDEDWVLRDVSFTIDPGETIAVVGHTGAGKDNAHQPAARFYDVQKGTIRIGGVDVRDCDLPGVAPAVRHRAAGPLPVLRNDCGQHPAGHRTASRDEAIEQRNAIR